MRVNVSINSSCTPPPGYCGAFAHLISSKGGALAILRSPGVWHLPIPGPPLTFWHARASYPDLSQSCTQSLLAFWSVGERRWENGNLHYQKTWESGLSAHASVQNGSENDSSQESLKLILSVTIVHTIFFNDKWYSLVSSETERWFECLWALWFKFLFCVHDFCPIFSAWWFKMFILRLRCSGCKESIFTACHSGKLKLAFTSPNGISTSPPNFLMSRIDFTVLL